MAFEIPFDLIKQVQISLREEANISSYDPNESSPPNLPALEESLAALDPSPEQLRCNHCKGRLLRGSESVICVFCGREPNQDATREPIKFKNMLAFRWLLDSLDVDGSEIVGPSNDKKESNRENMMLSDLLDLEIKWPSEDERFGDSFSDGTLNQNRSLLNLVGINHDSFLSDAKQDVSNAFDGQGLSKKQLEIVGSSASTGFGNLSFFENSGSTDVDVRSSEKENISNSFTAWESNFQSNAEKDVVSTSEKEVLSGKDIKSTLNAFQSDSNVNFSQKNDASQTASGSSENMFDDAFSGWDANFQSAASGSTPKNFEETFDAFASDTTQKGSMSFDMFASSAPQKESESLDLFTSSTQKESESLDLFVSSTPTKGPESYDLIPSSTVRKEVESFDLFASSTQKEPELSDPFASSTSQQEANSFDLFASATSQKEPESFDPFVVSMEYNSSDPLASSTSQKEPESFDPFSGSGLNLSAHMDTVFGEPQGQEHREPKDDTATLPSTNNNGFSDDMWGDFNSAGNAQTGHSGISANVKEEGVGDEKNSSFPGSGLNFSAHMDTVFVEPQGQEHRESRDDTGTLPSTNSNWFSDDMWGDFNSVGNAQAGHSGISINVKEDSGVGDEKNSSFPGFDWTGNDKSQASSMKASNVKTIDVDEDSSDVWSDFTGSTSVLDSSNIHQQQTTSHMPVPANQSFETNLFGSNTNVQTLDFGSFSQADLLSGGSINQSNSTAANLMQSDASVTGKIRDMGTDELLVVEEDPRGGDFSNGNANTTSNADAVESLISQMHDLSFMLDNQLSIPKTC